MMFFIFSQKTEFDIASKFPGKNKKYFSVSSDEIFYPECLALKVSYMCILVWGVIVEQDYIL